MTEIDIAIDEFCRRCKHKKIYYANKDYDDDYHILILCSVGRDVELYGPSTNKPYKHGWSKIYDITFICKSKPRKYLKFRNRILEKYVRYFIRYAAKLDITVKVYPENPRRKTLKSSLKMWAIYEGEDVWIT